MNIYHAYYDDSLEMGYIRTTKTGKPVYFRMHPYQAEKLLLGMQKIEVLTK